MSGDEKTRSVGMARVEIADIPLPQGGLKLSRGAVLPSLRVAYETYGRRSPAGDNVVFICHALTGDAHVAGRHSPGDRKPGWWDNMVGPGKGIDTDYYFVVCANILGGCMGTTGPSSVNPATGRPYGSSFPAITISDMVDVQKLLLEHLGVKRLAAVIGGSLGGMQALEWAIRHPGFVERTICIASGASLSAQALAFDIVSREAILADPGWMGGDYYGKAVPSWGLAHARKIGHITYLSAEMMQEKFGRERSSGAGGEDDAPPPFQVQSYLDYQGRKLVERFDANSYLRITEAIDDYNPADEHGSLAEAFSKVSARVLVIALSSDWLFPPEQSAEMANALLAAGKSVSCCTISAPYGHDAFLVDVGSLADIVRAFLPWVSPTAGTSKGPKRCQTRSASEHEHILSLVKPRCRVLDLGCGGGELMSLLAAEREASVFGVDKNLECVIEALDQGLDVFQGDLDKGLAIIKDRSYDYAVLGSTLQQVERPRMVLREMARVARECIVTFPNFAHWNNRISLGLFGIMPKSDALPFEWYDSPNIHLTTLRDFRRLCAEEGLEILDTVYIPAGVMDRVFLAACLREMGAQRILVRMAKKDCAQG